MPTRLDINPNPWGYDHRTYLARFGHLPPIAGGEANPDPDDEDDSEDEDEDDSAKTGASKESKKPSQSQADVDAIVRRRLARERKKIEEDVRASLKAEKDTEDAKKRGDFSQAETGYKTKITELEAKAARVAEYDELARARLKRILKDYPEVIRDLAPDPDDEDLDPLDIERWIATKGSKALKAYEKEHGGGDKPDSSRTGADHKDPPRGKDRKSASDSRVSAIIEEMQENGDYRPMF